MSLLERIRGALSTRTEGSDDGTGRQGRWPHGDPEPGASDDIHALDVERDPRGGMQSPAYRTADPRDLLVEDGVAMMGPAGSPVDDERFGGESRAEHGSGGDSRGSRANDNRPSGR